MKLDNGFFVWFVLAGATPSCGDPHGDPPDTSNNTSRGGSTGGTAGGGAANAGGSAVTIGGGFRGTVTTGGTSTSGGSFGAAGFTNRKSSESSLSSGGSTGIGGLVTTGSPASVGGTISRGGSSANGGTRSEMAGKATGGAHGGEVGTPSIPDDIAAPPASWTEHWFEHVQVLERVSYDQFAAIYFDPDVSRAGTEWIQPYMSNLWRYTVETYGGFNGDRLYAIFHEDKYAGGHPSTYFDGSHDNRSVSDCGPGPWTRPAYILPTHETAHVVEISSHGVHGSPAFGLWGDSKWSEFYVYDAYVALGMNDEALKVYTDFIAKTDDFPRAGTAWFRDWFYPLWRDYGHAGVMARYFELLAAHFPKTGNRYSRDLNWGEYVHFTSAAAGTSLKELATAAFGWPAARESEFVAAQAEFPDVTY